MDLLAGALIKELIASASCGDDGTRLTALLQETEHGAGCILVPAFLKIDLTCHDPGRAQEEFHLVLEVIHALRQLLGLYVEVAQDASYVILCGSHALEIRCPPA